MFAWFEKRIDPFPSAVPQQPPKTLAAFCWHYSREVAPWLVMIAVLTAAIAILQVVAFSFLGTIVDWLGKAEPDTFFADEGATLAGMAFVILVVIPALGMLHALIMHQTIFGNYPMLIRWKAHRYILGQSFSFFQDEFAGRVATKVMQAALGVRETVTKLIDVLVYVVVYFGSAVVLVATMDFWMMLPFLAWLLGYAILLRHYLPKMRAISELQSDARSTMTGRVVDSYTNIMTVKLFAHSGREEAYVRESMDEFLDTVHPQMRIGSKLNIGLDVVNVALLFSVVAVGLLSWQAGNATIGAIAVAVGLVMRLEGLSHWVMWEMAGLFENIGMAHDGMLTIARERDVADTTDAKNLSVGDGRITFDAVTFHYGKDGGVLSDLCVEIEPGQKVGLVGRSGAGKSTLVNLLLRLYDLEGGRIMIDGQDIAHVTQDSLRSQIGMVTQDTSLLHRSVRDNIAYGRPDATDDEIIAAARRANAHDYILDLVDPQGRKGYDAHVGERGVKLSGGQRQRIAIARVFLKNAPILVLDEATSALDSEVEAAIQESLNELMKGKTVIAIAHRLSTIANLDRLVVMDAGRIVEDGDHQTLAEAGGLYADLWARQSGGFLGLETSDTVAAE